MSCNLAMEEINDTSDKNINIVNNVVDKTSDKYKVTLKFINKILENIGKPCIDDLTDLKNIDRNEILVESNTKILEEMESEIWKHHEKIKCGAYHKSDNRTLNVMRGLIRESDMKLCYSKKEITEKTGVNKGYRRTHYIYHIE